jgi:hypothetical protein
MMENSLNSQILDLENESKIVSYIIYGVKMFRD